MPVPDQLLSYLVARAERTGRGSAQVTVSAGPVSNGSPEHDWGGAMHGVVDFGTDRCRLDGDAVLVFDGPAIYTELENGRWARDEGTPGRWGMCHPRVALEALRRACTSAVAVGAERFSAELDRGVLDRIVHAGLYPGWIVSADVGLDQAGRVALATLMFRDPTEPTQGMDLSFAFESFAGPVAIDLPRPAGTQDIDGADNACGIR
jgi:hypothetical protein